MRYFLLLLAASLWSCGGQAAAPVAAEAVPETSTAPEKLSLAEQLEQASAKHKQIIVYWGDEGIWAETLSGQRLLVFTGVPSAHPSFAKDALFYMATESAEVRRVDLQSGEDKAVAQLPDLKNPCFEGGNALSFIQANYDVSWDHSVGKLCLRIQDRNDNMASVSMQMLVELTSGKVESSYLLAFDDCKTPGLEEGERICAAISYAESEDSGETEDPGETEPSKAIAEAVARMTKREGAPQSQFAENLAYGRPSPSGKWIQFSDFELSGDYIYSGLLFFNLEEGRVYALDRESKALRPLEYAPLTLRENAYEAPDGICMVPGESSNFWSGTPDLFVFDTCVAGIGILDLSKKAPARTVEAMGALLY